MDGIAILDSGNYALRLCCILERKGYVYEVTSTPCQIARNGCGYCLRFPLEYRDMVFQEALQNNIVIREIYKVVPGQTKHRYERIF